jgi:hypothetical protein
MSMSPEEQINEFVGPLKQAGLLMFELMEQWIEAGFTREEAFDLVKTVMSKQLGA